MMRTMRENTKWIMLATAVAFVALMVFEWGMDITGRSSGGFAGELGRVNAQPVTYDAYIATYRTLYDQIQREQTGPITSEQNAQIEEMAWDQIVTRILIEQELARRGIEVTDEEIRQAARFSPPPEFRDNELFQTDGRFDLKKYQDFLATRAFDQQLLLQLESYYRDVIPRTKLLRQVTTGIYMPDTELWQRWRDTHERVQVRYVPFDPDRLVPDTAVSVSGEEIETYYQANREEFATPARATVKIAILSRSPAAEDSAAARTHAEELRREILAGADFAEVARRESADSASARAGGDLGTFRRGDMVKPFEEAAFRAPIGTVTEPVLTQFGFHLIRVERRKGDERSARHILIPIRRGEPSEVRQLTLADSLEALGERMPLDEAAADLALPLQTIEITRDFPFAPGVGRIGEGAQWAFEDATEGEVSPVFETEEAHYAVELVSRQREGHLSLADAEPTIREQLLRQKRLDRAAEVARSFVSNVHGGAAFEQVAYQDRLEIRLADPFSRADFAPGLGRMNEAIGTAFGLEEGQTSGVVRTSDAVVVLQVVKKMPADSTAWEEQKQAQRAELLALRRQQRLEEWIQALKVQAKLVDRRKEVLRQTTDAPVTSRR
ncbi:MAG: peptidylprolyl isomerase [Gemmatimonadetes bacterium]|nr:peptidylprolyl isomerase [Gemmatimonadota bacterium]